MGRYFEYFSQTTPKEEVVNRLMEGSIDIHIHFAPDPGCVRRYDGYQMAEEARKFGMRAIVLKSHCVPSTITAYAVSRAIPEVQTLGSWVLDEPPWGYGATKGGLQNLVFNAKMGCKMMWFPLETKYAHDPQREFGREMDEGVVLIDENGELKPEYRMFLDVVKEYDLAMGTGHCSPEEAIVLVKEARAMGITKIVATHCIFSGLWGPYPQEAIRELADLGAIIEYCYRECQPLLGGSKVEEAYNSIKDIGAERCLLSTDFGQISDPSPAEGMHTWIASMLQLGMSEDEVRMLVKDNPARLLGLDD